MDNIEKGKRELEERFRRAVAALHSYCEDRSHPMEGDPRFAKLLDEFFAARDALAGLGDGLTPL
jgi:hypothetical protein